MRAWPLMFLLLAAGPAPVVAQTTGSELPDIGTPASQALSLADEYKIGLMIVRQLREAGQIIEDPEINGKLVATGQNVSPGGPAEFAAEMNAQIKEVARVGKELDIRPGQN